MSNSGRLEVPLFALLIGINNYKSRWKSLGGPIADARSMNAWLNWLGTPSHHIVHLFGEEATYNGIISSFRSLKDDKRIQKGDAIFIYYAGHGTQLPPPRHWGWPAGHKYIQAMVPYDCECINPDTGKMIPPIPDYFLGTLLGQIAETKGNNVDRVPEAKILQITMTNVPLLVQCSFPISLESHVLLAACKSDELALELSVSHDIETTMRGAFTTALLKILYKQPLESLRYCDIYNHIRLSGQTPQCEGNHVYRKLFDSQFVPPRQKLFAVRYRAPTANYQNVGRIIEAGLIHNINQMSKFSLYQASDKDLVNEIGILSIIDPIGHFSSAASVSFKCNISPEQAIVALQRDVWKKDDLRIYIPPGNRFERLHNDLKQYEATYNPSVTRRPEEANIKADRISEHCIEFTLRTIRHNNLPVKEWVHRVRYDRSSGRGDVFSILASAAHFYGELRCMDRQVMDTIEICFYELARSTSDTEFQTNFGQIESWGPVDPTINLCRNGVIYIPHDPKIRYGLKLHNRNAFDLYTNVFYFNNANLSIVQWFSPYVSLTHYRPDLRAGLSFTVGYGDSGTYPLTCENDLNEAQQGGEVGYLRIYLSTQPVNLSYLPRDSPFETKRGMQPSVPRPPDGFLNITIPIVQRRT